MSATVASLAVPGHPIPEPLTWEQICERYPDEWVCLVDFDDINDTDLEFRTARVVGHGKTRREPYDQARPWLVRYEEVGHFLTGPIRAVFPRVV